jgi:hypothetical protein
MNGTLRTLAPYAAVGTVVVVVYMAASAIAHMKVETSEERELRARSVLRGQVDSLRSQAAAACEKGEWSHCLTLLDRAKQKDPEGDDAGGARLVRRMALAKLGLIDASSP